MARGRWCGWLRGLALTAGSSMVAAATARGDPGGAAQRAESPVLAKPPYQLTGWQAGVPVITERDIADLPEGISGTTLRKADGSTLVLIAAHAAQGLCLLCQFPR